MKKILYILISLGLLTAAVILIISTHTSQSQYLPPFGPVPPPEMIWDVRTDYSGLTAYEPVHFKFTRMRESHLPELIPSNYYGTLLPYSSVAMTDDGRLRASMSGFVTKDGVIVTDLIYDNVSRAYNPNPHTPLPAYQLSVHPPSGREAIWDSNIMQAVCALDGSWITPFDYVYAGFSDEVFFMMKDYETFDIDVYDYNGRLLYNMLDHGWTENIHMYVWPGSIANYIYDGYGFIQMEDNTHVVFEAKSGNIRHTEFYEIYPSAGGLTAVRVSAGFGGSQRWGFVNTDFEFVISPVYANVISPFHNGSAVVETFTGVQQVINTKGEALLSVPGDYHIWRDIHGDEVTHIVYSRYDQSAPVLYTADFTEVKIPHSIQSVSGETDFYYRYLGGGWFSGEGEGGSLVFNNEDEIYFPGKRLIHIDSEYIIYIDYNGEEPLYGVIALDGRVIIEPEPGISVSAVIRRGKTTAFVVNTAYNYYSLDPLLRHSEYRLVDTDGSVIRAGAGVLTYDVDLELYHLLSLDYFAWLDADGNTIISIPLMSYALD